jgi:CheY-like chemotaxis protein
VTGAPGPASTPAPPAAGAAPVSLFYSYAHEDESLRDELQDHLMILERRGVVRSWHDRAILPGHDWSREIDEHLRRADIVLLLISKDFIASDYIMGVELAVAMERQQRGEATVVPVLLRPVDLQPEDAADMPFVGLLDRQGLPRDLKPVTSWPNRDEAWTNVASGLRATVNAIRVRRPSPATPVVLPAAPLGPLPPAAPSFSWPSSPERPPSDLLGLQPDRSAAMPLAASTSTFDPFVPATEGSQPPPDASPRLSRMLDDVARMVGIAQATRGGATPDAAAVRAQALRLIDARDPHRVLWVDDHPGNNVYEAGVLARLQIEVEAVRSTDEALARLGAPEGASFDLVISDWSRDDEAPLAGLRLLAAMRQRGHGQPLVYYHGTTGPARAALAASAGAAGAHGEAVLPAELMDLVLGALKA